ncbi:MAG: alpha/beta hydrolase [Eubacteriaceae bacterium]|nr:alpha/beta hydrolase [Eubacteriaceae bacterium]
MQQKHIESQRGRTFYWTVDNGSPITLVFLPGLSADHDLFRNQTEEFCREYSLIVWDAPAHGLSRPYDGFTYPNAAEELRSILDAENISRCVLVGQSGGGFVAQSFYRQYPEAVAGIFAIGTCPYDPSYYSKSDLFWLRQTKWMFGMYPDRALRKAMAKVCADTGPARENMLGMLSVYPKKELCSLLYSGLAGFIPEIGPMDIRCPVWLTVGEHDRTGKVMTYNRMWHEKEGYPLYIIEGAAHNANDDQPGRINGLLREFIGKL